MQVELTVKADESELPNVLEMISSYSGEAEISFDEQEYDLSDEERIVLQALSETPDSALRVVHEKATEIDGSPFNDFRSTNGWNDERKVVREHLWELKRKGLTRVAGQRWQLTEEGAEYIGR